MIHAKLLSVAALAGLFSSCANNYSLPKDYTGPTATIQNTGTAQDAFKASVFRVSKVEGKNSLSSPMRTPYGGGPGVMIGESKVQIPAGQPIQLTLSAHDHFAADGAALVYTFGGNVAKTATETFTFTPKANATYLVNGQLGKESSSVWMNDAASGQRYP
ncbi:hypothetical protein [Haloferula sp.]|uniref:hypothetical protein n=1 Tax=Haloferula sp. TaxID=2497595 RepID=UPI003C76E407